MPPRSPFGGEGLVQRQVDRRFVCPVRIGPEGRRRRHRFALGERPQRLAPGRARQAGELLRQPRQRILGPIRAGRGGDRKESERHRGGPRRLQPEQVDQAVARPLQVGRPAEEILHRSEIRLDVIFGSQHDDRVSRLDRQRGDLETERFAPSKRGGSLFRHGRRDTSGRPGPPVPQDADPRRRSLEEVDAILFGQGAGQLDPPWIAHEGAVLAVEPSVNLAERLDQAAHRQGKRVAVPSVLHLDRIERAAGSGQARFHEPLENVAGITPRDRGQDLARVGPGAERPPLQFGGGELDSHRRGEAGARGFGHDRISSIPPTGFRSPQLRLRSRYCCQACRALRRSPRRRYACPRM